MLDSFVFLVQEELLLLELVLLLLEGALGQDELGVEHLHQVRQVLVFKFLVTKLKL